MRTRLVLILLLLLALGFGAAGWGWGWHEHERLKLADFDRQRLGFLDAENKRLGETIDARQRADDLAASSAQRKEIERTVTELRALPFKQPVKYREIPRSQLPEILRQKLAQQVPDKEFDASAVGLAALGLLPPGIDLKKTYLALLGEQIGAFYDQHSQELFTFSGQSLGNAQNRVILAHELTHALEDQHFNLSRLPLEAKGDDDRVMAASALVEGDATLVMNRYMVGNLSAAVVRDSLASAFTTDVRQLAAAPRFLRDTLLFPYLHGLEFCQTLYEEGGWQALAEAFAHPPTSSSEILHPDLFLQTPRQEPVVVTFPRMEMLGQSPVDDNVLGEFGIRQLLAAWLKDEKAAGQAAEGWRGDRYLVFGNAAANSYIWQTEWTDRQSAGRFWVAMSRSLSSRYRGMTAKGAGTTDGKFTLAPQNAAAGTRQIMLASLSPTRIAIIDAQDAACFAALQTLCPPSQ